MLRKWAPESPPEKNAQGNPLHPHSCSQEGTPSKAPPARQNQGLGNRPGQTMTFTSLSLGMIGQSFHVCLRQAQGPLSVHVRLPH